jgi:hypothetical protein
MIQKQHMKCESVVRTTPADGQNLITCQDNGEEFVYKILGTSDNPVVAMIDYHSNAKPSAETATPNAAVAAVADAAVQLIEVASADQPTMRLANAPKDELDRIAEKAADDPNPDGSNFEVINAAHMRNEQRWEQVFASSTLAAYGNVAAKVQVPFEYPPRVGEDGLGIVQGLANAALRAHLRCDSIYHVEPISDGHGWRLICDHKKATYVIELIGRDWKLLQVQ